MGFVFERDTTVTVKRGKRALPINPEIQAAVDAVIKAEDWRTYQKVTVTTEKTGNKRSAKIIAGTILRDLRKIAKANREADEDTPKYRFSIRDEAKDENTYVVMFAVWPVNETDATE